MTTMTISDDDLVTNQTADESVASKGKRVDSVRVSAADPLVGRCFVIFGDDGYWQYQGEVRARLNDDAYLVQLFECLLGYPSTMMVATIAEMSANGVGGRHHRSWEFFEDDEHLLEWCRDHSRPRHAAR